MIETLKAFIRSILVKLPVRVTTNTWYDHCTHKIISKHLQSNSNCIDIGCHKGEVLDLMIAASPNGLHYGFEPIPMLFDQLIEKYKSPRIKILQLALAADEGTTSFNYVKSNPAYSGLIKRSYDHEDVVDETIQVETKILDNCIPSKLKIDLIKIDVEGGEFGVFKGSHRILTNDKPLVIFEHGIGASDHYGTTPADIFDLLNGYQYRIYILEDYLQQSSSLSKSDFEKQFYQKLNCYFVAAHRRQ